MGIAVLLNYTITANSLSCEIPLIEVVDSHNNNVRCGHIMWNMCSII